MSHNNTQAEENPLNRTARWCSIFSALAILAGPIIAAIGAFSVNALFIGGSLLIIGALGLYAGMKHLNRPINNQK